MAGSVHWEALKGGYVDENQLREVVALDDDDDHSFSRQIVEKWFSQVEESLPKLKQHLYVGRRRALTSPAMPRGHVARLRLTRGPVVHGEAGAPRRQGGQAAERALQAGALC